MARMSMVPYSTEVHMATINTEIVKENFSGSWASTWSDSHDNKDQTRYVYICAPAWYVVASANWAALYNFGVFQMYFSYWTGEKWSDEYHVECGATGGDITLRYGHNRDEGNLSGQPSWFNGDYPLWRIRYWPSRNNSRWRITVYAGGWGVARDYSGNYMNYPQHKKICSRGRSGDPIHAAGTTDDTNNVINNIFNPSNRTGSPILASNDSELVYYPYRD